MVRMCVYACFHMCADVYMQRWHICVIFVCICKHICVEREREEDHASKITTKLPLPAMSRYPADGA